jgi:hypothetical protein
MTIAKKVTPKRAPAKASRGAATTAAKTVPVKVAGGYKGAKTVRGKGTASSSGSKQD